MARSSSEQWAKRVERWKASGLSAKDFAAEAGLKPSTLAYWRWRLSRAERAIGSELDQLVKAMTIRFGIVHDVEPRTGRAVYALPVRSAACSPEGPDRVPRPSASTSPRAGEGWAALDPLRTPAADTPPITYGRARRVAWRGVAWRVRRAGGAPPSSSRWLSVLVFHPVLVVDRGLA